MVKKNLIFFFLFFFINIFCCPGKELTGRNVYCTDDSSVNTVASNSDDLKAQFGEGDYLLFLTADHGVANVPGFLEEHNIPSGTLFKCLMAVLGKVIEEIVK